jgi:hypothetical protein
MDKTTETSWKKIFEEYPISEHLAKHGVYYITADQIKETSGREPRLMAKFDTRESRPSLLKNTSIFAVKNGKYALLNSDSYHDVEPSLKTETHLDHKISSIETLPWETGYTSESQVIDASVVLSLLQKVVGESDIHLTIRGRLRSPDFKFDISTTKGNKRLTVSGVQIEVDAGFEGDRVYLIEAKIGTRANFLGRQLYYPYRMWKELGIRKEIIPIFLMYSNKTFSFRIYKYQDDLKYDSIQLISSRDFVIGKLKNLPKIESLITGKKIQPPEGIPFPQADDFRKVIDLVDAVTSNITRQSDIAEIFDYEPRQADYYGNAAAFLGLIKRTDGGFTNNDQSFEFTKKDPSERLAFLISHLSKLPVFNDAIRATFSEKPLTREKLADKIHAYSGLNENTSRRRAVTVESWVNWLKESYKD